MTSLFRDSLLLVFYMEIASQSQTAVVLEADDSTGIDDESDESVRTGR